MYSYFWLQRYIRLGWHLPGSFEYELYLFTKASTLRYLCLLRLLAWVTIVAKTWSPHVYSLFMKDLSRYVKHENICVDNMSCFLEGSTLSSIQYCGWVVLPFSLPSSFDSKHVWYLWNSLVVFWLSGYKSATYYIFVWSTVTYRNVVSLFVPLTDDRHTAITHTEEQCMVWIRTRLSV